MASDYWLNARLDCESISCCIALRYYEGTEMVLLIRTSIGKSEIDGVGLFADEDIKKGTIIWRYEPPIDQEYTLEEINKLSPVLQEFMAKYAYLHGRTGKYILCGDNARFTNHSDTPNMLAHYPENLEEGIDIAARDIRRGEELTCDYNSFDLTSDHKLTK